MMTLKNVLDTMTAKADVCVMLNSYTAYAIPMQDCLGNHYAQIWLACAECNSYTVLSVDAKEMYGEEGRVQWTITLDAKRDEFTDQFSRKASAVACATAFDW